MERVFQVVLGLAMHFFLPRHNAHAQFMRAQLRILRARIPADRIVPTPAEKAELLRWGAAFDHDVDGLVEVVKPATYRRWLCLTRGGFTFKRSGLPRIVEELRRLVGSMARENIAWGYRRIVEELKKLGVAIGVTSVKRSLPNRTSTPPRTMPERSRLCPG